MLSSEPNLHTLDHLIKVAESQTKRAFVQRRFINQKPSVRKSFNLKEAHKINLDLTIVNDKRDAQSED